MNYATTTELRFKSKELIKTLMSGKGVKLIHRSKALGTLILKKDKPTKIFDGTKYLEETKDSKTPLITKKQLEKNYHDYIVDKYGKYLSGQ